MNALVLRQRSRQMRLSPKAFDYLKIYRASATDRIRLIKEGVSAQSAKRMITDLRLDQMVLLDALNLKTATVNRKAARNESLSPEDSERVIGVAKLMGQLEATIEEAGDPKAFDAADWLSQWLREPMAAFGGMRPIELLDTMEGQALVSQALAQAESGAYA